MHLRVLALTVLLAAVCALPAAAATIDPAVRAAATREGKTRALVVVAAPAGTSRAARKSLAARKRIALRGLQVVEDFKALPVAEVNVTARDLRSLRHRRWVVSVGAPRRGGTAQEGSDQAPGADAPPAETPPAEQPPEGEQPAGEQPGQPGGPPVEQPARFLLESLLGTLDGRGVEVVIADTGAELGHDVFGSCPRAGAAGCRVVLSAELAGRDGKSDDDAEQHGTHVAAVVAASAPGAEIVVADVFRATREGLEWTTAALLRAVDLAVRRRQAGHEVTALNLSIVEEGSAIAACSAGALGAAVRTARANGIAVVAAAGNGAESSGRFRRGLATPACHADAIAVGAVHDGVESAGCDARVACFSQSGPGLDLLARGVAVEAGGRTLSGTSQATPQVAAAIAALSAAVPLADPADVRTALLGAGEEIVDGRSGAIAHALDAPAALARLRAAVGVVGDDPGPQAPAQPGPVGAPGASPVTEPPAIVGAPAARLGGAPTASGVPLAVTMPSATQAVELLVSVDGGAWSPADPAALSVPTGQSVRLAARAVTADSRPGPLSEGKALRVDLVEAGDPRLQTSHRSAFADLAGREVGAIGAGAMFVDGHPAATEMRGEMPVTGLAAGTHRVAGEGATGFVVLV